MKLWLESFFCDRFKSRQKNVEWKRQEIYFMLKLTNYFTDYIWRKKNIEEPSMKRWHYFVHKLVRRIL